MAASKRDKLKSYQGSLEHARKWREQEGYDALWVRMVDFYRNRQLPQTATEEDRITVNVFFSTVNVILPSTTVNNPKITVMPTKPEDEDRAVITEAIVNYQWVHYGFQEEIKRAVKDALMVGHGWVKTGWKFEERDEALDEEGLSAAFDERVGEADAFAAERPDLAADLPTNDEIAEALPTTTKVVVKDEPTLERVSFHDVYVDPEATTLRDARWICQRLVRPLDEVRQDERYRRSVRRRLKADAAVHPASELQSREWRKRHAREPHADRVTIYEWWDLASGTMCVFAHGGDDFLIEPTASPFKNGHPFEMIRNYEVPDHFYPMGDLEAIESLQLELNKTRSQMMQARKKFARKYLVRQRAFNAAGRQALESDDDNTMVPVVDDQTPFTELIAPVPQVPLPADLYNHSATVESDIAEISGVSEYQKGQLPETRRTATEAAIISDSVNARSSDKLSTVEKFIAACAKRIIQLNAQFITEEQIARVVGPDGLIVWVPYDETDVSGEYDFEVEGGSTQPRNETVRRQEATALMQAVAPFVDMGVIDPVQLARHVLQEGFGIKSPQKFIHPQALMQSFQMGHGEGGITMAPFKAQGVGGPQGAPMGGQFMNAEGMDPAAGMDPMAAGMV